MVVLQVDLQAQVLRIVIWHFTYGGKEMYYPVFNKDVSRIHIFPKFSHLILLNMCIGMELKVSELVFQKYVSRFLKTLQN